MMYCERCRLLFDGEACPSCGSGGRAGAPGDACFLTERDGIWSGTLADVLEQNHIPFLQEGGMGAGLAVKAGPLGERFRFFVTCADLPRARELVEELFGAEA